MISIRKQCIHHLPFEFVMIGNDIQTYNYFISIVGKASSRVI